MIIQFSCKTKNESAKNIDDPSIKIIKIGEYPPSPKNEVINIISIDDHNNYIIMGYAEIKIKFTDLLFNQNPF